MNLIRAYAEKAGNQAKAAKALNQILGSSYSAADVWKWAEDVRSAPARVCNAALEDLGSEYRVPVKGI